MDSIGVSVLTSRLFRRFKTSVSFVSIVSCIGSSCCTFTAFFGFFTISPLSRLFNTSFARRTTLSGTPASFATSIPKLSSAPPRTIRRRNVMSSPRFFTAILKFCTPGKRSSSSVSSW